MYSRYIKSNIMSVSILIFVVLFYGLVYLRPGFLFNLDGSLRSFGLNRSKKTILPAWLLALILAFLSYLISLYLMNAHRFQY